MEWIIIISVFAFDLIAKSLVENFLDYDYTVPLIPYFLNARKVHNYSAAFGSSFLRDWFGDIGARIFFCVFAVAASVAFILVLIRNKGKSRVFRIAVALFVAGAMGNCIDRMALGYVRDFIEFEYFGLTIAGRKTWAYIFNIADVALVTGVLLIVFYFLFLYRDNDSKKVEFSIDTEPNSDDTIGDSVAETQSGDGGSEGAEAVKDSISDDGGSEGAEAVKDSIGDEGGTEGAEVVKDSISDEGGTECAVDSNTADTEDLKGGGE